MIRKIILSCFILLASIASSQEVCPFTLFFPSNSYHLNQRSQLKIDSVIGTLSNIHKAYTIRFDKVVEKQTVEISIFDMTGKLLFKESKSVSGNELNMSNNLLNGAYTVKIKLPDGTYDLHKIIITK